MQESFSFVPSAGPTQYHHDGRFDSRESLIEKLEREIIYLVDVMEIIAITLIGKMPH